MKRWRAEIRHKDGESAIHEIEEISDLHNIVERGRDFNDIWEIKVTYQLSGFGLSQ